MDKKGKVYIIGAGPGDPDLITVKGMNALYEADTVLYDKLANTELLKYCKVDAEYIFAGKEAGKHYMKQEETIKQMIKSAKSGKTVVRLKGGDPLIFGRGAEEGVALREAGVDFEIIPGISAATGAGAYAGIPLTHRNVVTQTVFVTAHETPGKETTQVDWNNLAQMNNTSIVIYMGGALLPKIIETLIENGMPEDMPSAVVEHACLPCQRSLTAKLKELPGKVKEMGLKAPMVTIISPTAELHEKLNWYEKKPLFGKKIVVTRARDQARSLYKILSSQGALAIPFPCIRTASAGSSEEIIGLIFSNDFDWMVFSSENGVRWFFKLLQNGYRDARILKNIKIAVIGSGTAEKLREFGLNYDFMPSSFTSEYLVDELTAKYDIKGQRFLRIKGCFKRDPLTEGLRKKGGDVIPCEVYDLTGDKPDQEWINYLKEKGADAVLFTSISTVDNFYSILGEKEANKLFKTTRAVAIGPVTGGALEQRGVTNLTIAGKHNLEGLVETLIETFNC